MFNYLAYPKAGWVLHMLRSELGEGLYRRCIKTYLERHAYSNVVTEDLRSIIEELSGRSYDQFFDQWLYHGRQPELTVAYQWDEAGKLAKLAVQQTQELNANVLLFKRAPDDPFQGRLRRDRPPHPHLPEAGGFLLPAPLGARVGESGSRVRVAGQDPV